MPAHYLFDRKRGSGGLDGDRISFDEFYRRSFLALVRHLFLRGAELEEAKDAAQEAMISACRRWDTIESPKAYVWIVAVRIWMDRLSRGRRGVDLAVKLAEGGVWPPQRGESDGVVLKEEQQAVVDALAQLPDKQRAVMAFSFDGFEPTAIAEMLGMDPGTVRSNLRHARSRLRALYSEPGGPWPGGEA